MSKTFSIFDLVLRQLIAKIIVSSSVPTEASECIENINHKNPDRKRLEKFSP